MKYLASLLLVILISAWTYPTVSLLLTKVTDSTVFYDFADEQKEKEAELDSKLFTFQVPSFSCQLRSNMSSQASIIQFNEFKLTHSLISLAVLVPPPKFI